ACFRCGRCARLPCWALGWRPPQTAIEGARAWMLRRLFRYYQSRRPPLSPAPLPPRLFRSGLASITVDLLNHFMDQTIKVLKIGLGLILLAVPGAGASLFARFTFTPASPAPGVVVSFNATSSICT